MSQVSRELCKKLYLNISCSSRFIFIIRKKYGKEAEYIIQELLYAGRMTLYALIIKVTYNLSEGIVRFKLVTITVILKVLEK